jgi:UDP-N-acetyl-D-mannosaminuronate dehydrogenase
MFADIIKKNDVVILESTVFPGATRELIISHFGRK